ncbi:hypothetical protein CSKR_107754, partial [Clonorchis sinensis]
EPGQTIRTFCMFRNIESSERLNNSGEHFMGMTAGTYVNGFPIKPWFNCLCPIRQHRMDTFSTRFKWTTWYSHLSAEETQTTGEIEVRESKVNMVGNATQSFGHDPDFFDFSKDFDDVNRQNL